MTQFGLRKLLLLVAIVAVVLVAACWLYGHFYWFPTEGVQNSYANMCVGELITDYLRENDNEWPTNWDDLEPIYARRYASTYGGAAFFASMRDRVTVDWETNPSELLQRAGHDHIRVIRLKDGSDVYWQGAEPNQMVYDYLEQQNLDGR